MRFAALSGVISVLLLAIGCGKESKPIGQKPLPAPTATETNPQDAPRRAAEDDAAAEYRLACKALPTKIADSKLDYFLTTTLQASPPDVLTQYPEAKAVILGYEQAVRLLRRGAAMKNCAFEMDRRGLGPFAVPDIQPLRDLAKRAVAYGKLLESQGRSEEAAGVYLDIIRMSNHIGQNADPTQLLCALSISNRGVRKLQSMLSRNVDGKIARIILDGLKGMPEQPFSLSRTIDLDRDSVINWFEAAIKDDFTGKGLEEARKAFEANEFRTVAESLGLGRIPDNVSLPTDRAGLKKLLNTWLAEYAADMNMLAKTADGAYPICWPELVKIEKGIEARSTKDGNPFLVFVPSLSVIKSSITGTEACLGATKLLAAACLNRASDGKHPDFLEGLRMHFPHGLPIDPFTGENYLYRMEDGLPTVEANGDDEEYRKARPAMCIFRLSDIKRREAERMRNWPADWEEQVKANHDLGKEAPPSVPPRR